MNQFANNLKKQLVNPPDPAAADTAVKPISATSLAGPGGVDFHQRQAGWEVLTMAGSADNDPVILVDADDVQVGTAGKLDAHQRGLRHRAISVLVRNAVGQFLLQRRSPANITPADCGPTPDCSHPLPGESVEDAARRRLAQEMGFSCPIDPLFVFAYNTPVPEA